MSDSAIEIFEAHRSELTGLVYRITGSVTEAEDIAQETLLKWLDADHAVIESPQAWLMKVATRFSLDYLKSARVQRQSYIGPWLPEPFIPEKEFPENEYEMDESLTMALLVLLEQLSPGERASFILHDIFSYNFQEIAEILDKTETACRKLASRARDKIDTDAIGIHTDKEEYRKTISAFLGALKRGDSAGLESLLSENVLLHSDGGGKAAAARKLLQGYERVCRFLVRAVTPSIKTTDSEISIVWFNGSPGCVLWIDGEPVSAFNFVINGSKIVKIHALRNPDKLQLFKKTAIPKTNLH